MNRFLVYVTNGRLPSVVHTEWDAAVAEAKRLTKKENCEVFIFGEVASCVPAEIPVTFKFKEGFRP